MLDRQYTPQSGEFQTGVIRPVECFREGWEMIRDQYWMTFGVVLVGMLVGSAIPILLIGPMMCGIYLCLLDKYEGKQISFDRLFKGIDHFLPSLLVSLIIVVPFLILAVVFYIPLVAVAFAGPRMNESELLYFIAGILAVELVVAVIMVTIHSLVIFTFPLIVDRKVTAWGSITLSARAVWANKSGVAGLFGLWFVATIFGYFAFCIGLYLVLPVIFASLAVAYRKVFPAIEEIPSAPPPPDAYHGL